MTRRAGKHLPFWGLPGFLIDKRFGRNALCYSGTGDGAGLDSFTNELEGPTIIECTGS